MRGYYSGNHVLHIKLHALNQCLDESGHAIPDVYSSEPVAIVFVDKALLWYKSETAKSTLKAEMARLIGKQSI